MEHVEHFDFAPKEEMEKMEKATHEMLHMVPPPAYRLPSTSSSTDRRTSQTSCEGGMPVTAHGRNSHQANSRKQHSAVEGRQQTRQIKAEDHREQRRRDSMTEEDYARYRRAVAEYAFLKGRSMSTALRFFAEHEQSTASIEQSLLKHRERRKVLLQQLAKVEGRSYEESATKHRKTPNPHLEHAVHMGGLSSHPVAHSPSHNPSPRQYPNPNPNPDPNNPNP